MHVWNNHKHLRKATMGLYTLMVFILMAAGLVYVVNSPHFPIRHVDINGELKRTNDQTIVAITEHYVRGNIFKVDLNVIKSEYEKLPWIKSVQVKRMWPDTIVIDLTERVPVAKWANGGLIDEHGDVFQAPEHEKFPIFSGKKTALPRLTQFYIKNEKLFEQSQLSIQSISYTERAAWNIILDNGVLLKLGRKSIEERSNRFLAMWASALLPKQNTLEYVDLRYKDGFAIKEDTAKIKQLSQETTDSGL